MVATPEVIDADIRQCPECGKQSDTSKAPCPGCSRWLADATWLFQGTGLKDGKRHFKDPHENFTTALFALYLLNPEGCKAFPVRRVCNGDERYRCERDGEIDLTPSASAGLRSLRQIAPRKGVDLVVPTSSKNEDVVHIENKPWQKESGRGQLLKYEKEARQCEAKFYILISCGNPHAERKPPKDLWPQLVKNKFRVILWEEVLARMDEADFARYLSETGTLKPYYEAIPGLR